jgi:hypothetical protein
MLTGALALPHRAGVIAGLVTSMALACYLPTLAPDLTWRGRGADGGDLITAAAQGGIPHPSGYPTYTVLAALFLHLPWGTPAWRVHLLSALAAALAAGLVSATVWHLLARPLVGAKPGASATGSALLAGGCLALAPLLWSQATIAEVYTGLAAFTAGLVLLTVRTRARLAAGQDARRLLLALAFLSGLALTHHLTILGVLPFLWGYLAWQAWQQKMQRSAVLPAWGRGPGRWIGGLLAFAAGLAPLLLLPARAGRAAMSDWDHPATLDGFWRLVSGADYRYLLFHRTATETAGAVGSWAVTLFLGMGLLAGPMALVGLSRLWRRDRAWAGAGVLIVVVNGGYTTVYAATDTQPYWLIGLVVVAGWLGLGLEGLGQGLAARGVRYSSQVVVLLVVAFFLVNNSGGLLQMADGSGFRLPGEAPLAEDAPAFLARLTPRLPPDAILLTTGDQPTFALWYARYVLDQRPDVLTLDIPLLNQPWFRANVRAYNPDLAAALPDTSDRLVPFITAVGRARPVLALVGTLVAPPGWRWQALGDDLWRADPP